MQLTPLKTEKILPNEKTLVEILDRYVKKFPEESILVISSKIIALCEGRVEPLTIDKEDLLQREATYYLPKKYRKNNATCTITHHAFIGSSGIDESNAAGQYVLLPKDSQKTASLLYQYLKKRFHIKNCGVIVSDSHSTFLRRGASGIALAYRGFIGLKDYRGKPDIFGRMLKMEQANAVDALAAAAVLVMGEGNEQTPLVLIEKPNGIIFKQNAPTPKELSQFFVNIEDDIFSPLIHLKHLKKGRKMS